MTKVILSIFCQNTFEHGSKTLKEQTAMDAETAELTAHNCSCQRNLKNKEQNTVNTVKLTAAKCNSCTCGQTKHGLANSLLRQRCHAGRDCPDKATTMDRQQVSSVTGKLLKSLSSPILAYDRDKFLLDKQQTYVRLLSA